MDQLTELGLKYGTDKATNHQFTNFYHNFLQDLREDAKWIMEIGVLNNSSLRMWEDYFPNATIVGVDNQDKFQYEEDRIKIFLADQGDNVQLQGVVDDTSLEYDLILDDGSHLIPHQQTTLGYLFKYVKPGGYFIVEDLHTSHFDLFPDWYDASVDVTTLKMLELLKEGTLYTQYMSEEEAAYLKEHTDYVEIFYRDGGRESITAIIKKK